MAKATTATPEVDDAQVRAPRQSRTRAAQARIIDASIALMSDGDEFTMASVAERADVSVTAIYRRYANKDALLTATKDLVLSQHEADIAASVEGMTTIADVVRAFVTVLCSNVGGRGMLFPSLISAANPEPMRERGRIAIIRTKQVLIDALSASPVEQDFPTFHNDVVFLADTIVGGTLYRATISVVAEMVSDSWDNYTEHLIEMTLSYLSQRFGAEAVGFPAS
jgi:AcrR family transcriptional regulator